MRANWNGTKEKTGDIMAKLNIPSDRKARLIGCVSETDEAILLRLVGDLMPAGTTSDALLVISRLVAALGQRERTLGRALEQLDRETARANVAENTIRSMRGNSDDARMRRDRTIKAACKGAREEERRRVVRWLRSDPAGYHVPEKTTPRALADAIEKGEHVVLSAVDSTG